MEYYITIEEREQLKIEIKNLEDYLAEIQERVKTARELGDLSENEEYSTAISERNTVMDTLKEKKEMLESSVLVTSSADTYSGLFKNGSYVVVSRDTENGEEVRILQLGKLNCTVTAGVLNVDSTLGRAILNQPEGVYRVECREGNYINYRVRFATKEEEEMHKAQFPDKNTVLDRIFNI